MLDLGLCPACGPTPCSIACFERPVRCIGKTDCTQEVETFSSPRGIIDDYDDYKIDSRTSVSLCLNKSDCNRFIVGHDTNPAAKGF